MKTQVNFNFNANTVLGIIVLAGILFMFIHLVNPVPDIFKTLALGLVGALLFFIGLILWISKAAGYL